MEARNSHKHVEPAATKLMEAITMPAKPVLLWATEATSIGEDWLGAAAIERYGSRFPLQAASHEYSPLTLPRAELSTWHTDLAALHFNRRHDSCEMGHDRHKTPITNLIDSSSNCPWDRWCPRLATIGHGNPLNTSDKKPSTTLLAEVNADAIAHYREMRKVLMPAPGVDAAICEVVLAMQLALRGHEVPFKIHCMRAMALGVPLAQLEALLLASVGVSMIVCEAARALEWLREAHAEQGSR